MGGGSSPPPVQNPNITAATQAGYNTAAGVQSQAGSSTSQVNPYGSLSYGQVGTGPGGVPLYQSNLSLSQPQQNLLDILTDTQTSAGQAGQNLIQGAGYGNQSPSQAIGDETSGITGNLMSQWLQSQQPAMTRNVEQLDTRLRNQGFSPGEPGYDNAMKDLTQGQQQAIAGASSQFQPQAFQEAEASYMLPASLGAQLAQFGQPQSPGSSLVQTPGLNIQSPDYTGAVSSAQQAQEQNYQAQVAQQNALMSGLFGLGGNVLGGMARAGTFSDRRLKTDIEPIGQLPNGLPVYSFKYIWSDEPQIGLMADDVLKVHPEAVGEYLGYKTVDYNRAVL